MAPIGRYSGSGSGVFDGNVVDGSAVEASASGPVPVAVPVPRTGGGLQRRQSGGVTVVKTAAAATAGGLALGAASVALARVVREVTRPLPGLARRRKRDIESSQTILIDIHLLKPRK